MDTGYRWALLGLGAMTVTLVAPQIGLRRGAVRDSLVRARAATQEREAQAQRHRELMLERTLDVRAGGVLSVDVGDGDVAVRSGSAGSASVKVWVRARDMDWGREVFERMQFEVGEEGDGLAVRSRDPRIRDHEWRDNRGVGLKIEITIPERFDVDIRTADGDVDIGRVEGRVDVHTSDGDVVLGTMRGPEISIETSDGDVTAESLEADRIMVRTSDGDVQVRAGGSATRITTSDGDISLNLLNEGEVELRTGDGDIVVYASPSLRADVELQGSDVHVDREMQVVGRMGRRGARGQLNGGGPLLIARTGDGTIMIRESRP
jgi:hypothetical protein